MSSDIVIDLLYVIVVAQLFTALTVALSIWHLERVILQRIPPATNPKGCRIKPSPRTQPTSKNRINKIRAIAVLVPTLDGPVTGSTGPSAFLIPTLT